MGQALFVRANPKVSCHSHSFQLAERFLDAYRAQRPNDGLTELDLHRDDIPSSTMTGWGKLAQAEELNAEEAREVERMTELVDQFVAADKVIFIAPM